MPFTANGGGKRVNQFSILMDIKFSIQSTEIGNDENIPLIRCTPNTDALIQVEDISNLAILSQFRENLYVFLSKL